MFSILIANYNNGKYFQDCYNSIIAQTYTDWECIIVDDCSTDNSVELIHQLIQNDARFKLYKNDENKGCGYTKRRCAELATGEICGFVDPDDAISKESIAIMIEEHTKNPMFSLIYSNFINCDEKLQPIAVRKTQQVENSLPNYYNLNSSISHFATFKMSFYKKTNGIAPYLKRAVDQDLYLKLYEQGNVKYIDYDFYFYRLHREGISTYDNQEKAYYWHWVVLIKMAERRGVNIENLFVEKMCKRSSSHNSMEKIKLIKKSRWLKIGAKLGLFKGYKHL